MLNLVTAFNEAYELIKDNEHKTPSDYAIIAYAIKQFNNKIWRNLVVKTSINRIAYEIGSQSKHTREALKRLTTAGLLTIHRSTEKRGSRITGSEIISLTPGAKLQALNIPNTNKQQQYKAASRNPEKGGDAA